MNRHILAFAAPALLVLLAGSVYAQTPAGTGPARKGGCIELTTIAEQESTVTAADGSVSKHYEPAARIVPGSEVVWTTTARNLCQKAAEKVVIDQPVPDHMVFVADSAIGGGTQITLSTDGREFKAARDLTARNSDGSTRPAGAADVRFVRWTLSGAIAPQDSLSVRYRAVLQ
jgi:uncharacterized repeat protein (TIGR01451 family)